MIYLDNNATTKPLRAVVDAMRPYFEECYFNASASAAAFTGADKPHADAAAAMTSLLNAEDPSCFIFTSGATESNNWVFSALNKSSLRGKIIISAIEHPSVFEPATDIAAYGFEVVEAPVDHQGVVRLDALENMLTGDTRLLSIMAANNVTGVLQPIDEIGRLIRKVNPAALFHTDATQCIGKFSIDLQGNWNNVDLLSFSAHKFHGPKGVGGLYIRPGIELKPLLLGGGQEQGLRSGTTNTPGLAGLAVAARDVDMFATNRIADLRNKFEEQLKQALPVMIHSSTTQRLSNTSCFSIHGVDGEDMAFELACSGIIVGTGAACSSGAIKPSKTILAMGVDYQMAKGTLRVSFSPTTTSEEIGEFLKRLIELHADLLV